MRAGGPAASERAGRTAAGQRARAGTYDPARRAVECWPRAVPQPVAEGVGQKSVVRRVWRARVRLQALLRYASDGMGGK